MAAPSVNVADLIKEQGEVVRKLKAQKAPKEEVYRFHCLTSNAENRWSEFFLTINSCQTYVASVIR